MIDNLIKFARRHHKSFCLCGDKQIRVFFELYKETTLVRTDDAGEITGFAVWVDQSDKIIFISIALTGDFKENFKTMRFYIKQFKKPVVVSRSVELCHN